MRNEKAAPLPSSADSVTGGAATEIVGASGTAATPIGTPETRARKTDFTVREIDAFIHSGSG